MTLKELEAALAAARANGATDATPVYLNHQKWTYSPWPVPEKRRRLHHPPKGLEAQRH